MTTTSHTASTVHTLAREDLLLILDAASAAGANRFIRQASLAWLAHFPGDLGVTLWLAKSLAADGKQSQAAAIAAKLLRLDPEYTEAQGLLGAEAETAGEDTLRMLRRVRRLLQEERYDDAELIACQAAAQQPDSIWPAVMQLQVFAARREFQQVIALAEGFRQRWPDCLQIALLHAEALLETGDEAAAVGLLHRCVVNDAAAQVPARVWGEVYDYRPLWPDPLAASFDLPIPAEVAARLGWNLLPAEIEERQPVEAEAQPQVDEEDQLALIYRAAELPPEDGFEAEEAELAVTDGEMPHVEPLEQPGQTGEEQPGEMFEDDTSATGDQIPSYLRRPAEVPSAKDLEPDAAMKEVPAPAADLDEVQEAFERVAKRLKQPQLSRADGRFPVYVILSTQAGLKAQYGESTLSVLDKEMRRLAEQVRRRPGWDALVYYPDSPESCARYGLQPADPGDPWKLKLAVTDLDTALAKKGEMIGAVLIVGGPQVVPYHMLPNPTDDADEQIASDNPYAVLDGNYFIPDWPVGRLPGEAGPDAGLLLDTLRRAIKYHGKLAPSRPQKDPTFWERMRAFLAARKARKQNGSLGYSAAVWRRSSLAVYRPIGPAASLMISPPQETGCLPPLKHNPSLAYFNLHGLVDSAEWYGHRDPADKQPGPDYPVALSPKDLGSKAAIPDVVFSEACYGAHIDNKSIDQALALKFLARGTAAVIGSTSTAYGSVTTPLIGADLLGQIFWKGLKAGKTVGEALVQAKVDLVREMSRRQGFLDGEDQKTLISFVLYGDPLASVDPALPQQKSLLRARAHPVVKTISDRDGEDLAPQPVPEPVLKQVKQIVAEYLPGLENGEVTLCQQEIGANGRAEKPGSKTAAPENDRVVVTVHKEVQMGMRVHHHVARVTLARGKMVKLAMTR